MIRENYISKESLKMSESNRPPFFPMMIDLLGKKILIVGGGLVASRRASTLIKCGADVTAVSPKFIAQFPPETHRINRAFIPEDITPDLTLVIAATDNRMTNHEIHTLANSLGIPVNVADCQSECSFFFPSLINSGSLGVSVCSAGQSSSLTHRLSERLRKVWPIWITEENNRKIR